MQCSGIHPFPLALCLVQSRDDCGQSSTLSSDCGGVLKFGITAHAQQVVATTATSNASVIACARDLLGSDMLALRKQKYRYIQLYR
jgi:hypothetical protein